MNSYDDFKKNEENNKEIGQNSIIFFNKKDQTTTKYGVYLNKSSYFKYMVDKNSHIKAVREINAYYSLSGILSYFMFTDMMLNDINVLENEEMKELTAVVFWKYLCEMAGIDFYKWRQVWSERIGEEELPKHFNVEIKSIPVSNSFAEKIYKMMASFIDNFKAPQGTWDSGKVSNPVQQQLSRYFKIKY